MNVQGRTAFITGAGFGIGRATAVLAAREGMRVIAADISNAASTVGEIADGGGQAVAVAVDVRDPAAWGEAIESALSAFGRIDLPGSPTRTSPQRAESASRSSRPPRDHLVLDEGPVGISSLRSLLPRGAPDYRAVTGEVAETYARAEFDTGICHAISSASAMLDDPDAFLDPFCVASVVRRNTNMLLGGSVVDLTRRRPIDFARSVHTVHHAAKRGLIFGIGSGLELNLAPFGYDTTKRVSRFQESIKGLRCLLDTGRMFDGVGRVGLPLESAAGRPQIWVAGNAPRVHRIAGQYGDGWITLNVPPEEYAKDRATVMDAASAAWWSATVCALSPWVLPGPSRSAIAAKLENVPLYSRRSVGAHRSPQEGSRGSTGTRQPAVAPQARSRARGRRRLMWPSVLSPRRWVGAWRGRDHQASCPVRAGGRGARR